MSLDKVSNKTAHRLGVCRRARSTHDRSIVQRHHLIRRAIGDVDACVKSHRAVVVASSVAGVVVARRAKVSNQSIRVKIYMMMMMRASRRRDGADAPVLTRVSAPKTTPSAYSHATMVVPVCGASLAGSKAMMMMARVRVGECRSSGPHSSARRLVAETLAEKRAIATTQIVVATSTMTTDGARRLGACHNALVTALLTDTYQLTMAYAYWRNGTHDRRAVFELFFRKNPFHGEFTVFAGLEEALRFVSNFSFSERDVEYLKSTPVGANMEDEFFEYLLKIDASDIRVYAQKEGSVVFPRVPLLRLEGPLATVQLLETTLLCLVNYASLVATNAARHRLVAGEDVMLLEFGLRRAQGVDGGVSASRYAYLGGFDATSNVEAGRQFGIPIKGTHAHSYVQSHSGWDCVKNPRLKAANGSTCEDFPALVMEKMKRLEAVRDDMEPDLRWNETNTSELAAFTSYALAFPSAFLALVDTYNVLQSGLPNFCAVALALRELGYAAVGIRLDSGDLSYLSKCSRAFLRDIERLLGTKIADNLSKVSITASNDIHEEVLFSLKQHGHEIDAFGIGTHLVTCLKQPALGCVYKLVEVDETPRIKLSEDLAKVTIPGCKNGYRLFSQTGEAIVDVMTRVDEPAPKVGERMLCRHPFLESKRAYVVPSKIQPLFTCVWDGKRGAPADLDLSLETSRARCKEAIKQLRSDHLRYTNPTPYKVSVSAKLYDFIHDLWLAEAPVGELR